jgi:hypothetical protein
VARDTADAAKSTAHAAGEQVCVKNNTHGLRMQVQAQELGQSSVSATVCQPRAAARTTTLAFAGERASAAADKAYSSVTGAVESAKGAVKDTAQEAVDTAKTAGVFFASARVFAEGPPSTAWGCGRVCAVAWLSSG